MAEDPHPSSNHRACDACRFRRVKCVFALLDGSKCLRCAKFQLNCTFDCPPKPRGRRKKLPQDVRESDTPLVESAPSQSQLNRDSTSLQDVATSPSIGQQSPALVYLGHLVGRSPRPVASEPSVRSPNIHMHNSPSSIPSLGYPTDTLCSRDLLMIMLDDYLRLMYPLVPLIHRPSFIRDLHRDLDKTSKDFHSLLLGLVAVVASTIPERFRVYQRLGLPSTLQSRADLVHCCHTTVMNNRSRDYFDQINYCKWAIAYCFRISFYQAGEHNRSRMMDCESMQIARLLGFHSISEYSDLNCIETQLRKKGFFMVFYSYVHNQLQSLRSERLSYLDPDILDNIRLQDLLPLEVDDEMIFEDRIEPQPAGKLCVTSGYVIHSRVFWAALRSTQYQEESCRCHRAKNPLLQIAHLKARLKELKYMLDRVEPRLRQWAPIDAGLISHGQSIEDAVIQSQFAIMRSNLHSTQLWLQSILLDRLEPLLEAYEPTSPQPSTFQDRFAIWSEREEISRQLLHVLHSSPQQCMEANGLNITEKLRDVAVGLLNCPYASDEEPAKRAMEYVRDFTAIMARFEVDPIHTSNTQSWIDTGRLAAPNGFAI